VDRRRITPNCCEAAAQGAVFLDMPEEYFYDAQVDATPRWVVSIVNHEYGSGVLRRPAKFCPFCAAPVPEIEKKPKPPSRICVCTDTGYYCDTCGHRLNVCGCRPPEEAWRIKQ
jgi:hypothetical protein